MKNIILKFSLIALIFTTFSCTDNDNIIDVLLDQVTTGGFIRTLEVISDELDIADTNSFLSIRVEEQDEEFGGLLGSLEVWVTYIDRNDETNNTVEALAVTFNPADFTTSDNGLPMVTMMLTYGELLTITGADTSIIANNDRMDLRLVLNLTDGRSFTNTDVNGNVSAGLFFQAPFFYGVSIKNQ